MIAGADRLQTVRAGEAAPPTRRGRFLGPGNLLRRTLHRPWKEMTCLGRQSSAILVPVLLFGTATYSINRCYKKWMPEEENNPPAMC